MFGQSLRPSLSPSACSIPRRSSSGSRKPIAASSQLQMELSDQQVAELEARVADLHKLAQQLNQQAGKEAQATAVYKELAVLDDEALDMRLRAATLPTATSVAAAAAAAPAYYTALPPPPRWASRQERQRVLGAVLGSMLGDAAACSCQWVYSLEAMEALAEGRPGLEFFEPPQCPFFDYPLGAPSPYFQQAAVLLRSLADTGSLDLASYSAALYSNFGPGYGGYRDRSTKNFLRRYAAGALPPLSGSEDDQANAFARLPPLVALYAGSERSQLVAVVDRMIRVTQNDAVAVAYGTAAALVLESVILGASVTAAVAETVVWLQQQAEAQPSEQQQLAGQASGQASAAEVALPVVPAALWGEVAQRLLQAAELAPLLPLEAATRLGRNCHLPNSLQTPLQVLLHLEHRQWAGQGQDLSQGPDQGQAAGQQQQQVQQAQQQTGSASPAAVPADTEAEADFCLPCSMGACTLPGRPVQPSAGARILAATLEQQQQQQPASLPPEEAFVEAVRLAIRSGGCCASRAGVVGALMGALGGELPADWPGRVLGYQEVEQQAQRLVQLRD